MAKSKEQKQAEALARKRANYNLQLETMMKHRPGGKYYDIRLLEGGMERARRGEEQANATFGKYLKEAQLDAHGNPKVYNKPSKTTVGYNGQGLREYLDDWGRPDTPWS